MPIEELLREQAPQVLSALVRRYGDFDACEDAVQEALLAASLQWPGDGVPDNPRGWLITVASRRRIEVLRTEAARQRREEAIAAAPEPEPASSVDDSLTLLMLCCHPSLSPQSQVALTLRAVGGLTTSEIARQRGWRPRARVHTATVVGDDPIHMLTGIIPATARVLDRKSVV